MKTEEITLDNLFKSKPVETKEPTPMAAKKGRKPAGDVSIKDQIISFFKGDKTKELGISDIHEHLKVKQPKIPVTTVRSTVVALQSAGTLITARKDGRSVILRLRTETDAEPIRTAVGKGGSRVGGKALKISKDDIRTLQEAIKVLEKYQGLMSEIQRVKDLL